MMSQSKLNAALRCLSAGWYVIPLCWPVYSEAEGEWCCGCGRCNKQKDIGKRPLLGQGYQTLRADEDMIRKWWSEWPQANIGVLLEPSRLLIVDADGQKAVDEIEQLGNPLTMTVRTGKGKHFYYQRSLEHPAKRCTKRGQSKAIDILANGYIVAPGSRHVSGVEYTVITESGLATPPAWAVELLQAPLGSSPELRPTSKTSTKELPSESELVEEALRFIPPDDYDVWLHIGMALHSWDCNGEGRGDGRFFWDRWSRRSHSKFDEKAQEQTWRSFKPGGGITIASLFEMAKQHGWTHPGRTKQKSVTSSTPSSQVPNKANEEEGKKRESQARVLVRLSDELELFSTPEDEAYATFQLNEGRETWPLYSKGVRRWLIGQFFEQEQTPPGPQAINSALSVLEARAFHNAPRQEVFIRVAGYQNSIFVDLCNEKRDIVEISSQGWEVKKDVPVRFRRARGMRGLPHPVEGGNVNDLFAYLNLPTEEQARRLVLGWLLMCFYPKGPYPLLVLGGEQGSAKSTTAKMLRSLVDPSRVSLNSKPRDERDLAISAHNSWVLIFDNVSGLSGELSDALCRMATGGGMRTRALFTDSEEALFHATRPIILTGIGSIVTRQDLADRAVIVNLPPISDRERQDEANLWRAWRKAKPGILGALFSAVGTALENIAHVKLTHKPRMADFARWVTAAEPGLGW